MARSARDTTEWVAGILGENGLATETAVRSDSILRVSRERWPDFDVGILSERTVDAGEVEPFVGRSVSMVINVPKYGVWTGRAIERLAEEEIAFGGVGDLMSATNQEDVRAYVSKEFRFVERGLQQHSRVTRLERIADRVFKVHRAGGIAVTVMVLNEYDLTGDHIRTALSRYGEFDVVLKSNPNGRITKGAYKVAQHLGVEAFKWGELLRHIAKA